MKITRRLLISVICLVVSLAFCVWAIFAWFANKSDVRGEGISTSVLGPELVDLKIDRYRLSRERDGSYTVTEVIPDDQKTMPSYNNEDEGTTAVLIKLTLIVSSEDVGCNLSVNCASGTVAVTQSAGGYVSALSNSVVLYNLGAGKAEGETLQDGVTENADGAPQKVIIPDGSTAIRFWSGTVTDGQPESKTVSQTLNENWRPEAGSLSVSLYLFMDYDSSLITNGLYRLDNMSFTTSMNFETDISFTVKQPEAEV